MLDYRYCVLISEHTSTCTIQRSAIVLGEQSARDVAMLFENLPWFEVSWYRLDRKEAQRLQA